MQKRSHPEIRDAIGKLCAEFPGAYWRKLDEKRQYPTEFISALSAAGYLSILIPEEYGGSGQPLSAACAVLEEIQYSGCNGSSCHAQMYIMGTLLRHGSEEQKQRYLPKIASGDLRLQAFGVTEPSSGTDTTRIRTIAERHDDHYIVNGSKVWISRTEHSDLMMLLVRTTPREECAKRTDGMSVLLVDLREAAADGLTIKPIRTMMNHSSTELFFDDVPVPAENLIGEEGKGFRYIMDGMNAERILIASECIGDGKYFIEKSVNYAKTRKVFNREIGMNQGIQFPIAECYSQIEAASLMVDKAATLFDEGKKCGAEANMAKMLAADASWKAGTTAMETFGGFGFSKEYDIERKFRETRLYQTAPVSRNLILSYIAEHVLNLPRSF